MDHRLKLLFGIHIHQPLGNFLFVFEKLYQTCYRPFLEIMSDHPALKFSFHSSGHLLQWLEENHSEFVDRLSHMVGAGQVEILGSGFYEPILAAIPRKDRRGQLQMYRRYLKKKFRAAPKGIWLTERVWEPQIAEDLAATGIRYVIVDDRHFLASGHEKEQLDSYYVTEAEGKPLAIFPIDQKLRYMIPFRPVTELTEYLETLHGQNREAAIYIDDGEKFGGWPGTQEWVYEKKWLHGFLESLEALQEKFLETTTFSEFMQKVPAKGLCYLPNASYAEMEEWALPATKGVELEALRKSFGSEAKEQIYLRGGHWKNFLVKYPEANRMHKKMLLLSDMAREKKKSGKVIETLYKAQCNDAYWHGVFGGLYLPFLRHEVWRNLAELEEQLRLREALRCEVRDVDLDGHDEVWAHSRHFSAVLKPSCGGQLKEYTLFSPGVNYLNTLTRRFESYHGLQSSIQAHDGGMQGGIPSIHQIAPEAGEPPGHLNYDAIERGCYIDHLFLPPITLAAFKKSALGELGDFADRPFKFETKGPRVKMARSGQINCGGDRADGATLTKEFTLTAQGSIEARYDLLYSGKEELRVSFGIEFNLALPVMNPDGGRIKVNGREIPLGEEGEGRDVKGIQIFDRFSGRRFRLDWSTPAGLLFFPVRTVSRSEKGFEYIPQELAFMPYWSISLTPLSSWTITIKWEVTAA